MLVWPRAEILLPKTFPRSLGSRRSRRGHAPPAYWVEVRSPASCEGSSARQDEEESEIKVLEILIHFIAIDIGLK
jgi:hypothetical protein